MTVEWPCRSRRQPPSRKSDREAAGVLSAAQRHTHFLDSPRMAAVLGRSDFRFNDLKHYNATVFLVLPPDRLSTYSRWLRLLASQSLIDMARDPMKPAMPVLDLLDEGSWSEGKSSISEHISTRDLMIPDEVMQLPMIGDRSTERMVRNAQALLTQPPARDLSCDFGRREAKLHE